MTSVLTFFKIPADAESKGKIQQRYTSANYF